MIFLEHKKLYNTKGLIPEEEYTIPIGSAEVKKEGTDLTIVSYSYVLHKVLDAAKKLKKSGISAEIIDLRTVKPIDVETIANSVKKTGRLLIVQEAWLNCSIASEVSSLIGESCFDYLDAPIMRIAAKDSPIPFSPPLEQAVLPQMEEIIEAAEAMVKRKIQV